MYLSQVDFMDHLGCCLAAEASFPSFASAELFSMGRSVSDMEDVPKHWSSWQFYPVELLAGINESIMHCFRLISTSACTEFVDIVNHISSISEVLDLGHIRRFLRRMVTVCDYCEPKSDSLCSDLGLDLFDDRNNSRLDLCQLATH